MKLIPTPFIYLLYKINNDEENDDILDNMNGVGIY